MNTLPINTFYPRNNNGTRLVHITEVRDKIETWLSQGFVALTGFDNTTGPLLMQEFCVSRLRYTPFFIETGDKDHVRNILLVYHPVTGTDETSRWVAETLRPEGPYRDVQVFNCNGALSVEQMMSLCPFFIGAELRDVFIAPRPQGYTERHTRALMGEIF